MSLVDTDNGGCEKMNFLYWTNLHKKVYIYPKRDKCMIESDIRNLLVWENPCSDNFDLCLFKVLKQDSDQAISFKRFIYHDHYVNFDSSNNSEKMLRFARVKWVS